MIFGHGPWGSRDRGCRGRNASQFRAVASAYDPIGDAYDNEDITRCYSINLLFMNDKYETDDSLPAMPRPPPKAASAEGVLGSAQVMSPLANSGNADKERGRARSLPIERIVLTAARLDRRFQGLADIPLAGHCARPRAA